MKYILAALACWLGGCTTGFANTPQQVQPPLTVQSQSHKGMHVVQVMINGQGPFRIGVDTGAPGPLKIDKAIADRLGLKTVGSQTYGDGSGKNEIDVQLVAIDTLQMGAFQKRGLQAAALDIAAVGFKGMDGIFGMEVFADSLLTLDFAKDTVTVSSGSLPEPDGKSIFPYTLTEDGLFQVALSVRGKKVEAVIDTGRVGGVGLVAPKAFVDTVSIGEPKLVGTARTLFNRIEMFEVDIPEPVKIGELPLPIHKLRFRKPAEGEPTEATMWDEIGILGAGAFVGATLRLDQKNRRIQITL